MIQGRAGELAEIHQLVTAARAGRGGALVIRGEVGIGKTALLRAVDPGDMLVLRCTGVESEVELGFAALQTLLAPLPDLPDALTNGTADLPVFTTLLRVLGRQPVVVVVDDAHFVDRASLAALLFAARRLRDLPVAMLFSARDDLDTADLPELRLTGLSVDDARRLLPDVPAVLRDRLVEVTGGNPLALVELGPVSADVMLQGTVPLSERLRTALLDRLPARCQELLLVVAAEDLGDVDVVRAVVGPEVAFPEDVLVVEGRTVRFRHPLVRSAVYGSATAAQRGDVHRAIAEHVPPERARWHRALATVGSDEELAGELEWDAHALAERGGVAAVASALRRAALLSGSDVGRTRRTVAAAYAAWKSGQAGLARTLIDETHGRAADTATRLRLAQVKGLVDLYGGDQVTAYGTLVRSAAEMPPAEGAYTLLMASEAAFHANRVDDAVGAAVAAASLIRLTGTTACGWPSPLWTVAGWIRGRWPPRRHPPRSGPWRTGGCCRWPSPGTGVSLGRRVSSGWRRARTSGPTGCSRSWRSCCRGWRRSSTGSPGSRTAGGTPPRAAGRPGLWVLRSGGGLSGVARPVRRGSGGRVRGTWVCAGCPGHGIAAAQQPGGR
ncbi:hypothetical protein GCM10029964_071390 [Kibdelosporangium lantanae]